MSIDAQISKVILNKDNSGYLTLIDRPPDGCKGQPELYFDEAPDLIIGLEGKNIWGGSSFIMLGDIEIANRIGYTTIKFHDYQILRDALNKYVHK